ncbi:MAG: TonB C-terminal domain-containing protein [Parvibaculum sp.]|uniref:energy transducer TonB n=1 Tax=Parvibaculum sp. TaxID=2024848 RepID=UPI0025DF6BBA|nr:energy transducer TonB [Parvibaculum sp.]MCE9648714.1 TonB C-terminal domain-containing protein [Parvibaculum sp.]
MQVVQGPASGFVPLPVKPVEPLVPPVETPARQRWLSPLELLFALLLNILFFVALFYRPQFLMPEERKEPQAISVQLVPPAQAPPKPKPQPQPKPEEQQKPKEQPKPEEPKKPEEKKPEEKKPEEKKAFERRESGGDPKLKQGAAPKVEEKTKEPPEKEAKKPKPDAPKQPAAEVPDWAKKLAQGYDLPKTRESSTRKSRGSNQKEYQSDMVGEGGGDAYLNAMRDQVNAHVTYPISAGGAVGAPVYALVLDRSGAMRSLRLIQSAGRRDLDVAGAEAIRRSAPFRPLPPDYPDVVTITAQIPITPGR